VWEADKQKRALAPSMGVAGNPTTTGASPLLREVFAKAL